MESVELGPPSRTTRARAALGGAGLATLGAAVLPLLLLGGLVYAALQWGGMLTAPSPVPPDALARLDIERVVFQRGEIVATVVNSGPVALTIAQVLVNDALWDFSVEPDATLPRLGRARVSIPYPWLEAEPHQVAFITSTGLKFTKRIALAAPTPELTAGHVGTFGLLGVYAGVVPVYLGLLWWPFLRRVGWRWRDLLTSLAAGVLLFLAVDLLKEALGTAAAVPGPFRGVALIVIGLLVGGVGLLAIGRSLAAGQESRRALAYLIAGGIGLHNLGEGLAIGSAYALGEVALGALLVVGFAVHNATEGFAIISPLASDRPRWRDAVALGLLAGGPTVVGSLLGGFAYSPLVATLFLALGAGAIGYVLGELARTLVRQAGPAPRGLVSLERFAGLLLGLLLMYLTGLLIAV